MNQTIFHEDEAFVRNLKDAVQGGTESLLSDFIFPWEISLSRYALGGTKFEMGEWGGYEGALRKRFLAARKKLGSEMFHISCYEFKPASLLAYRNRRTVLDSLLSVGIGDGKVGDILTASDSYFLYMNNLSRVPLIADIAMTLVDESPVNIRHKIQGNVSGTVSSPRLDSICALAFKPSREKIQGLIENGGAMVNFQYAFKPGREIQEGSTISLRGFPRFKLIKIGETTKKGRLLIEIEFLD